MIVVFVLYTSVYLWNIILLCLLLCYILVINREYHTQCLITCDSTKYNISIERRTIINIKTTIPYQYWLNHATCTLYPYPLGVYCKTSSKIIYWCLTISSKHIFIVRTSKMHDKWLKILVQFAPTLFSRQWMFPAAYDRWVL